METTLTIPRIEGFTEEQIAFTMDELMGGTDRITLQILLFKKFGLFDFQANELMEKVQNAVGNNPIMEQSNRFKPLSQNAHEEGVFNNFRNTETEIEEKQSNGNIGTIVLGFIILGIGLVVTLSGTGVIAYGAIIVGIMQIVRGMSGDND